MRALMMDFAGDKKVWNINNEFMFGKSLLVSPVVDANDSVSVYLPETAGWYDFWTNEKLKGGQMIDRQTPLNLIPLYMKAGSIIPFGPEVQYATEKSWDNLEIHVYLGANGSFTLYEDEFDNYNYEKGAYTEIPVEWNDNARKLTIGARKGSYNGMLKNRKFTIILQDGTQKTVDYNGKKIEVKF